MMRIYLEDVLEDYSMDDALDVFKTYIDKNVHPDNIIWFIKGLVADFIDDYPETYKELMDDLKEMGQPTEKVGKHVKF